EAGGSKSSPEDEFDAANGLLDAIELVDGRVVVLDRVVVWLFDIEGKEVWRSGRRGEGPGEFRNLDAGCQFGPNELIVQDGATRRLTVLDLLDGEVKAMFHLDGWR